MRVNPVLSSKGTLNCGHIRQVVANTGLILMKSTLKGN